MNAKMIVQMEGKRTRIFNTKASERIHARIYYVVFDYRSLSVTVFHANVLPVLKTCHWYPALQSSKN